MLAAARAPGGVQRVGAAAGAVAREAGRCGLSHFIVLETKYTQDSRNAYNRLNQCR